MSQAGRYRHRIVVEHFVVSGKNELNEDVGDWQTFLTAWARITPIRGREYLEGKMEQADATATIAFRTQPGKTVTPVMRVAYGERIYEIVAPPVDIAELGKETQLTCREIYGQSAIC